MDLIDVIIFSVVEGITEFLPISSTGHLILTSKILLIPQSTFVKDFEIIIQLGAILSIIYLYFDKLIKNKEVWKKILTAFIPTALVGFILFKFIKDFLLGNLYLTLTSLLLGGVLLIILEIIYKEKDNHVEEIEKISYSKAFIIGLFQSLAIVPGVSRSAATIIPALFLGTKRKTAAEFSFLLAIPTMLAATGLDLIKSEFTFSINEWVILAVGFIGNFITALLVVKWFLVYIQNHSFIAFGIYRILVALIFWYILIK
ncbi:MAG: undecaprenyl-diphosphatase UppP [Candidatus Levybacteria bacterium RIFCSPLOWO2_01_FULL_36_13]|nr:MAG: undecaprenyl-diphosphatase UppP [Candidatus Levybacteria bacterium RIFCSPHIGHO2_01_FULL_36_15b]OGH34700.1 MAG: undecaprenyl-diphosphatase UppP [Candidatus Levybacteria bacterium RIFCSPLOWO2_01_FULL_36_13]